jgi:hypothetical protein
MTYYHLRFNVYESPGFPIEKETWINLEVPLDDWRMRQRLEKEYQNKVSIIVSKVICLEEFKKVH